MKYRSGKQLFYHRSAFYTSSYFNEPKTSESQIQVRGTWKQQESSETDGPLLVGDAVGAVAIVGAAAVAVVGAVLNQSNANPPMDMPSGDAGENLLETRITPRSGRDWDYLARRLGVDRNDLSDNLHSCKFYAGVPPNGNVQVDDETGDIYWQGEIIGNIREGC